MMQKSVGGVVAPALEEPGVSVIGGADQAGSFPSKWSLKRRIQALGVLVGATLVCGALLGLQLFHMTESARMSDATTQLNLALDRLARQYDKADSPASAATLSARPLIENGPALRLMTLESLADVPGAEGGFYSRSQDRLLGYAFPTYLGSGPKMDIPEAERPTISRLAREAIASQAPVREQVERGFDVILFVAAPLVRDNQAIGAVWLMHRLPGIRNPQWRYYSAALLSMLIMAGVVAWGAWLIARRLDIAIGQMVEGIRTLQDTASHPVPTTGYAEVDRVVSAINHLVETVRLQQTRREHLERQLQQADRLATLGRLVAGVAHEVRNPLSSIRLKIQLARRGTIDLDRLVAAFGVVEQEVSRLDRLVARLLSVAKPAAVGSQPTNLNEFLSARLQHWQARASEAGIRVTYTGVLHSDAATAIDRDRLGQILDNLIYNALEALAGTGGTIMVSLIRHEHDSFSLTVTDSGPGISPEARHHLFEPFFTTKPQGTGLGLFLSAEMARAWGGNLAYVESPHGGACFTLTLPFYPAVEIPREDEEPVAPQGAG